MTIESEPSTALGGEVTAAPRTVDTDAPSGRAGAQPGFARSARVAGALAAGDAAVPYQAITPDIVLGLQRTCGNAGVTRYLIGRQPAARRVLAREPEEPLTPALPGSASELGLIGDFSGYSEDDRMAAVGTILQGLWVGPLDEGTLERIWGSFGDKLADVASRNLDLFEQSAERGAELLELPQLEALRTRFRTDVIGLARQHLVDNRAYVTAQLERLGLDAGGPDEDPGRHSDELAAIQRDAANVSRAQEAQRELRGLQVGYEYRDDHPGVGLSMTPLPSFFDPERPPQLGPEGSEQPALASWQATKEHYDRLVALIAGIANQNPAIYAALRGGKAPALAAADPQEALRTVNFGLRQVLADIDATGPKLTGRLDYRDLKPIHDQLFAGERGVSGEDWSTGAASWVGHAVIRDHEATEFWITLGLGSLAAAAFVVATLATAGSATFFIAAGLGAGIGIGQAAHSWEQYVTLAEAARTNVRDDLGLLSAGQASGALVEAVLDTAFVFVDVFATAGRLARAGVQAGRLLTREAAEQAEREIAQLARREAMQQAEERAARSVGEEVIEGSGRLLGDEVPVKIGTSPHTLKVIRSGDRVRVWLCTDCSLLIDKIGAAIDALPAGPAHNALRTELGEIMATAQRFEASFQGQLPGPQILLPRLNRETNALATRLAALSRTYPDIESLIFFRTFIADAEGAAQVLGAALARRLEDELGREAVVQLMRDIGPEALRNLSDLPGIQLSRMLEWVRGAVADDANLVLRWLGESQTGAQASRLLTDLSPETIRRLVVVSQRNRVTAAELRQIVDQLGVGTIKQLESMLGAQFTGRRLQELERMEMFVFDPALQRLLDAGRGNVARTLGSMANRTVAEIEGELVRAGMQGPRAIRGMRVWTHADGSVVRIKTGAEALRPPTTKPHIVREIAEGKHRFETTDIIAKVTDAGRLVSAGTTHARRALSDWFLGITGREASVAEQEVLLGIWGRAGHVPVIR